MAYLNANIPSIECMVRGSYMRNQEDQHDVFYECLIFGVSSIPGQVPLFNFLCEDGGIWWHAPISAFAHEKVEERDLHDLCLWDSFSYHVAVTEFDAFKNSKMMFFDRHKNKHYGTYLFTLDWAHPDSNVLNTGFSEKPDQHKCGHVIRLDGGNYAIQPNNRVRVFDPSFAVKADQPFLLERKINEKIWTVEDTPKWMTEDSLNYHYEFKENKNES